MQWVHCIPVLMALTLSQLLATTVDPDEIVYLEKPLSDWLHDLKSDDFSTRMTAEDGLARIGEAALPLITELAGSKDIDVRRIAVKVLMAFGPTAKSALPVLLKALGEEDLGIRLYAIGALSRIGPAAKDALPALHAALQDKTVSIRVLAAVAIGKIDHAATERMITRLVLESNSPDSDDRFRAVGFLDEFGPRAKSALAPLKTLYQKESVDSVRTAVLQAVTSIDPDNDETFMLLLNALKDKNATVRGVAAGWLGKCKIVPAKAVMPLTGMLKDQDDVVRRNAVWALGTFGSGARDAIPAVTRALNDADSEMRIEAACTLAKISADQTQAMVDRLVVGLQDKDADLRSLSAKSLRELGHRAKTAAPALIAALKDPVMRVRLDAVSALESVDPDALKQLSILRIPSGKKK